MGPFGILTQRKLPYVYCLPEVDDLSQLGFCSCPLVSQTSIQKVLNFLCTAELGSGMEGFWISTDPFGCSHIVLPLAILRFDKSVSTSALAQFSKVGGCGTAGEIVSGLSQRLPTYSRFSGRSRMGGGGSVPSSEVRASCGHSDVSADLRQQVIAANICFHLSCVTLATFSRFKKPGRGLRGSWSIQLVRNAWKLQSSSGKRFRISGLSVRTGGAAIKDKRQAESFLWKAAIQEESHGDNFSAKVLAEPFPLESDKTLQILEPMSKDSEVAKMTRYLELLGLQLVERAKCLDHLDDQTEVGLLDLLDTFQGMGLKKHNIAGILTKAPSLVRVDAKHVKEVLQLLFELKFDTQDVSEVLCKCPLVVEGEIENMRRVSKYLQSVGISDISSLILARPQVLTIQSDVVEDTLGALINAGVPTEDLERIIKKAPELFSAVTQTNLKPKLAFLMEAGLKGGGLGKAIARRPNILNFPLERMQATAAYLQTMMGEKKVAKLIKRYAEVLVLDPRKKMLPVVSYLLQLGVKPEDIGKVILRRPQLLGYTLNGMQPTVNYLLKLGVQEEMLGKVITISPQVCHTQGLFRLHTVENVGYTLLWT